MIYNDVNDVNLLFEGHITHVLCTRWHFEHVIAYSRRFLMHKFVKVTLIKKFCQVCDLVDYKIKNAENMTGRKL